MKTLKMIGVMSVIMMVVTSVSALSLAEASVNVGIAANDPAVVAATMRQLSAADQVAYLSRLNSAIESMPSSPTDKGAAFLNANMAAMKNAAKGNLVSLLAETFATASPEALAIINERFANVLFNRAANPAKPISDEQMMDIAKSVMEKVAARTAKSNNGAVRQTFAILMFIRASNGSPANLSDVLVEGIKDLQRRQIAKEDWIPAALGINQKATYEPMLADCDAPAALDARAVLMVAGPQSMMALLADLSGGLSSPKGVTEAVQSRVFGVVPNLMGDDSGLDRVPRTMRGYEVDASGNPVIGPDGKPVPRKWWGGDKRGGEPRGYRYQTL